MCKLLPFRCIQLCLSIVFTVTIIFGGYYFCNNYDLIPAPASNNFCDKLQYTIGYCTFPQALLLTAAILRVALKRGFGPADNPLAGNEHYVKVEKNILTNTVEQMLSFILLVLMLTTILNPQEMCIVPLYSLVFLTGRIMFMIGYTIHPNYRVIGMAVNFNLTFILVIHLVYKSQWGAHLINFGTEIYYRQGVIEL